MILIAGATGTTGRATLQALRAAGAKVRVLLRDASRLPAQPGVEVAIGDFDDLASLVAALDGVDRVYVERVLGRPSHRFDDFVHDHRASFGG